MTADNVQMRETMAQHNDRDVRFPPVTADCGQAAHDPLRSISPVEVHCHLAKFVGQAHIVGLIIATQE